MFRLSTIALLSYTASAAAEAKRAPAAAATDVPAATTTTGTTTEPPATEAESAKPASAPPAAVAAPTGPAAAAFAPLKIETPNATLKLGLLAQPQFEAVGNADPDHSGRSYNLFVRRIRLLAGGTLFGKFEYFFDTDSPNLFKGSAEGVKSAPLSVQDAYVTFKAADDVFKVDAGYLLPPLAHNAVQGAGTLYGLDYFGNSFRHANAFLSIGDVGRDAGVQLRGLVADGHVEYRLGLFQGLRRPRSATEIEARNFPRVAGRIQVNVLDPETGFFYAGTYLGAKKVLSFGASYDTQNEYHHWSVDGFLDLPIGPGTLTAQANFVKWNGGNFVTALPKQTAFMAEAGYRFQDAQISPIVRFEYRSASVATPATPDEARYGLGVAYWPYGHNVNLKAFYTRIQPKAAPAVLDGYNQFQLQWQLYFY